MTGELEKNSIVYFTVATAGHVDHGKTSLLRALTGIDPDRLKEEKLRGLTTDLGFAHLSLKSDDGSATTKIGFVDVPGHGKFLKNMLAGVGGIDMALLVVAADEGPMPQTDQHAKILALLGVKNVLLIVTKIDLASVEEQQSAALAAQKMLAKYDLICVNSIFVSSTTKRGLDEIVPALLIGLKNVVDRTERLDSPVYLPIDRVFTKTGYGTVVTGTLVRGTLDVGSNVLVEPGSLSARIRGMESFGKSINKAHAGQRLAINLVLKQTKPLERGQALFLAPPTECRNLVAQFHLLGGENVQEMLESLPGQQIRLYHGTTEVAGHVRWLQVMECRNNTQALVGQISLTAPLIAEPGERFVIRYGDTGVTGGTILIGARARWLSRKKLQPLLEQILEDDYSMALQIYLDSCPRNLARADSLLALLPFSARTVLSSQLLENKLIALGDFITTKSALLALENKVLACLKELTDEAARKRSANMEDGISLESLRAKALGSIDRSVFQNLMKTIVESGRASKNGDKALLKSELQSTPAPGQNIDSERMILELLETNICLEIKELARLCGAELKDTEATINRLKKAEKADVVAYEFASSTKSINEAHAALGRIWQQKREISPSDFKEMIGVSRKYAMALLTYFDDHSVTRRTANSRILLKAPKVAKLSE
ncbi:MAG TPA: selenocysteine-specific translation elongation factor [Oculatellaceae cyanobacterium]